ncbi:oxysterol-binding protein-related protein 3-like [Tubulanus polymorphus]|uniref:oxysterol-binding protein-related protein 3-like n=1 Tax=Tubulanus polymorphus TaxID=672921 RepID=UPI003DA67F36
MDGKKSSRSPNLDRTSLKSFRDKKKVIQIQRTEASDTEGSEDASSLDSLQYIEVKEKHSSKRQKSYGDWEVIEGLKDGQKCDKQPRKYEGLMLKRRKWPMKGWHKRFFVLEDGILTYAKSSSDINKGKIHGAIDIGLSVISFKSNGNRIDIDAEELIYHLKVKGAELFRNWIERLKYHRLYRQNEIAFGSEKAPKLTDLSSPVDDGVCPLSPLSPGNDVRGDLGRTLSLHGKDRTNSFKSTRSGSFMGASPCRVTTWLLDSAGIEQCSKDLTIAQTKLYELSQLLTQLKTQPVDLHSEHNVETSSSPKRDKGGLKMALRSRGKRDKYRTTSQSSSNSSQPDRVSLKDKKGKGHKRRNSGVKSNNGNISPTRLNTHRVSLPPPSTVVGATCTSAIPCSTSNPNLVTFEDRYQRPASMPEYTTQYSYPSSDNRSQDQNLAREQFYNSAKSVHDTLKSLVRTLNTERGRLKQVLEQEGSVNIPNNNYIHTLRLSLTEALRQNTEMRGKLTRIHAEASLPDAPQPARPGSPEPVTNHPLLSHSFSAESTSMSEFFDAPESFHSASGSSSPSSSEEEASEEEEDGSEVSLSEVSEDFDTEYAPIQPNDEHMQNVCRTGRRSKLAAPKPEMGDFSLWNLLRKNIGKDLSKISMPVTLNEPINVLQKLCEELEYSELLDKAAECSDPFERMIYIAAFSVSGYAASYYRAGQKPFNPLLGETYECLREDKGWRFIAEQVSHHPPVSSCYTESKNFRFWQDMRIKNKFWGKSMEIQPLGTCHLVLPKYKDHYRWNKITTCVHNIFSGQRWVDLYGETVIHNGDITCRLTFHKASYWSSKRHEVFGTISNAEGNVIHHLFGKWTEGLYCGLAGGQASSAKCVWRPGSLPEDQELYYGFTRFAIELNELDCDLAKILPSTDTRFRPDQRLLEEGRVQDAETEKSRVEQLQRDQRHRRDEEKIIYEPRWFRKAVVNGREQYEYKGGYWEARSKPGFSNMTFPKLW